MRKMRLCTRVVAAFPDGNSALMLVAAGLRHIAGTNCGLRRYLNMEVTCPPDIVQFQSEGCIMLPVS